MVQWRSGNATVCKTAMRGFDSLLHLPLGCPGGGMVYTSDLKSLGRKALPVRVRPWAQDKNRRFCVCFCIKDPIKIGSVVSQATAHGLAQEFSARNTADALRKRVGVCVGDRHDVAQYTDEPLFRPYLGVCFLNNIHEQGIEAFRTEKKVLAGTPVD
jgi:hypothetical protein